MASHVRTTMFLIVAIVLGCDSSSSDVATSKTESRQAAQQSDEETVKPREDESSRKRDLLPAGDRFTTDEFSILIPDGWRFDPRLASGNQKLFLIGDGKGVAIFDETRSPLQLGLEVEHYPAKESIEERIKILSEDARSAPQRTLESEPTVEDVQLADGTKASIMFVEMIKQGGRKSLYMKLLVQDQSGTTWVTTGWIVAGKDSKLPTTDSDIAQRMKSFIHSFALAEKREP